MKTSVVCNTPMGPSAIVDRHLVLRRQGPRGLNFSYWLFMDRLALNISVECTEYHFVSL